MLSTVLSEKALVEAAGKAAFAQGDAYFRQGHVVELAASEGEAHAQVVGTQTYSVRIACARGRRAHRALCCADYSLTRAEVSRYRLKSGAEDLKIEMIEPMERAARGLQAPELSSMLSDGNER